MDGKQITQKQGKKCEEAWKDSICRRTKTQTRRFGGKAAAAVDDPWRKVLQHPGSCPRTAQPVRNSFEKKKKNPGRTRTRLPTPFMMMAAKLLLLLHAAALAAAVDPWRNVSLPIPARVHDLLGR